MESNTRKLLSALTEKTAARAIVWTGNGDEYKLKFQNGSVLVVYKMQASLPKAFLGVDILETFSYNFRLYNQDGSVIQSMDQFVNKEDRELIENLYKAVENADKKEDETYNSIFKELGI
jgi:hypothetical protein